MVLDEIVNFALKIRKSNLFFAATGQNARFWFMEF